MAVKAFWPLWEQVLAEMTSRGVKTGPTSYSGWNHGDPGLTRAEPICAAACCPAVSSGALGILLPWRSTCIPEINLSMPKASDFDSSAAH